MRYEEVKDEWAKLQTINEYITHIGWDEFKSDVAQGDPNMSDTLNYAHGDIVWISEEGYGWDA